MLDPGEKTRSCISSVNSRESTKDKIKEVHIIEALGEWQETDPVTGFQLVQAPRMAGCCASLIWLHDDPCQRDRALPR